MSKSDQFRQYARQCLHLAGMSGGSHRALMVSMANTWVKRADQLHRDNELAADERDVKIDEAASAAHDRIIDESSVTHKNWRGRHPGHRERAGAPRHLSH